MEYRTRNFEIASRERLPIRGVITFPREDPAALVVIVHGFKGFKEWGFFPWLAEQFAAAGFAACRFDMSRSGIGDEPGEFGRLDLFADDTYSRQIDDLSAVVEHLESDSGLANLPLFLLGHSRGGAIAILAGQQLENLHGVVTWSSIANVNRWDHETMTKWRKRGYEEFVNSRTGQVMRSSTAMLDDIRDHAAALDIGAAARRLPSPLLIVHGARDESVPVAEARQLLRFRPDATLVIHESGTHTFGAIHPLVNVTREMRAAIDVTRSFVAIHAEPQRPTIRRRDVRVIGHSASS